MIFNVSSYIGDELKFLDEALARTLLMECGRIQQGARDEWIRLAQGRLHSSRSDYIQGLQQADTLGMKVIGTRTIFEVQLVGRMPNNFEFGMDPFSMKDVRPGWLGGKKVRTTEDGRRYVIIPFRHSLSSAANLAYSGKAKQADLKTKLRQTVKEYGLDRMVRLATGQVQSGAVARVPSNARGVHSYLRGLTRYQAPSAGTTKSGLGRGSSQLMTFRIMGEWPQKNNWNHPGITAANILPEVEKWVDNELSHILDSLKGTL